MEPYSCICVLSASISLHLSDGWTVVVLGPFVFHNKLLQIKVMLLVKHTFLSNVML